MNLSTLKERLCAPLVAMRDYAYLRAALVLQWSQNAILSLLRRAMIYSYPTFLVGFVSAVLLVVLVKLWEALCDFVREVREVDISDYSRASWEEHLPRMRAQYARLHS